MDAGEAFFWFNKHWTDEFIKDFKETYNVSPLDMC